MQFSYKEEYEVSTVFFGGGTPSILPGEELAELMELLREKFRFQPDAEVTVECNPGTADEEKFKIYKCAGINRLSFGLQSADDRELALLGRIHTWEEFLYTYEAARRVGFSNINIDLMSALPGQTVASWEETLRKVLELEPQHISAYSLIIEEGTPFYERYQEDARIREEGEVPQLLPSEEDERLMYERTELLLASAGMHRYEISNYALPGYECRHNIGYWDGTEYVGFGLGAASLLQIPCRKEMDTWDSSLGTTEKNLSDARAEIKVGKQGGRWMDEAEGAVWQFARMQNTDNLEQYMAGRFSDPEIGILSEKERMEEFMFLGLRMINGVSENEFLCRFGCNIEKIYADVLRYQQELGLLERVNGRIRMTAKGLDVSNMVMAEFLL